MAKFFAMKIIDGVENGGRDYAETVTRYPQYKQGINAYLTEQGRTDLIAT
jgi:hypothetical protein